MWRRQTAAVKARAVHDGQADEAPRPVPSVFVASDFPCQADRFRLLARRRREPNGAVPSFVQTSARKIHHTDKLFTPSAKDSIDLPCASTGSYDQHDLPTWHRDASAAARSLSDSMAQLVLLSSCDGLVMGHSGFARTSLLWGDFPDGNVTQLPLYHSTLGNDDEQANATAASLGPLAVALVQPPSPHHALTGGLASPRAGPVAIYTATEWKETGGITGAHQGMLWWQYDTRHTQGAPDLALGITSVPACAPYITATEAVVAAAQERVAATRHAPGAGWVTTVLFNVGYLEMTKSFACNLRFIPNALERTLFIAADGQADIEFRDFAAAQGFTVHVVLWRAASEFEASMEYTQAAYYRFMLARACLELQLVTMGIHVHIAEADAMWARDGVVVALENAAQEGAGYDVMWTDDKAMCGDVFSDHVSDGTAMLNATRGSQLVLRYLAWEWGSQLGNHLDVEGAAPLDMDNEQFIWQHMHDLKLFSSRWLRLRPSAFPSGLWFKKAGVGGDVSRSEVDMAIIQNNWEVGSAAKIERAKDWGQWFLHSDGSCLAPQDVLPPHIDIGALIAKVRRRFRGCGDDETACDSARITRDALTSTEVLHALPFVRPAWVSNTSMTFPQYVAPASGGCWRHMNSTMNIPE